MLQRQSNEPAVASKHAKSLGLPVLDELMHPVTQHLWVLLEMLRKSKNVVFHNRPTSIIASSALLFTSEKESGDNR